MSPDAKPGDGILHVLDEVAISLNLQVCSLGMLLDPTLLTEPQISPVAKSIFNLLRLVRKLCPSLGMEDLAMDMAIITSRLDYRNVLEHIT